MPEAAILITGCGQRIGFHVARRLLEDGFAVIGSYRTERDDLQELRSAGVRLVQADFSSNDGIAAFAETILAMGRPLRAIIHNASLWLPDTLADDAAQFHALVNLHMYAPFHLNTVLKPLLVQGEGPRDIIHLTDYVIQKGSARHAAYVATKAGLQSLTRSFAKKYAPRIQVNDIAPALIMFNEEDDADYRQEALKKSAMQVAPGPEVIYQSIRFLLDNPYITGATVPMDGGRHLV